jgi:hypothetical protein
MGLLERLQETRPPSREEEWPGWACSLEFLASRKKASAGAGKVPTNPPKWLWMSRAENNGFGSKHLGQNRVLESSRKLRDFEGSTACGENLQNGIFLHAAKSRETCHYS